MTFDASCCIIKAVHPFFMRSNDTERKMIFMETGTIFKFHNDLDTDQIIASQYLLLPNLDEMKGHAFESLDPDFSKKVKSGDFVVGGENFGCGSSREQAPGVLKALGVQAVVAKSFARIFYRNSINIGLPVIVCKDLPDEVKTGDQMILDGPQRKGDLRRSRAGACNIVPNSTGAAKAIGLVIPELNGKLIGAAQRVPTPTGSTTILNAVVAKKVTVDEVNAAMKAAATESFGYNTEQIVSSDIVGMRFGSLFDATQTMVNELPNGGCQVQVVSWYDNENSYTSQMVRTIKYFAELN
mgnify:CR=1 FL=1